MKKTLAVLTILAVSGYGIPNALGEPAESVAVTELQPVPAVRDVVVANPRVGLTTRPSHDAVSLSDPDRCCRILGSAYNFPLREQSLVVRRGTIVNFRLKEHLEGVWYEKACGWLGVVLIVEKFDPQLETWTLLGYDGAAAKRCGPSIGMGSLEVPSPFSTPGAFKIRSTIYSFALPEPRDQNGALKSLIRPCGDLEVDQVHTKLRVVNIITPVDIEAEVLAIDESEEELPQVVAPIL